MFQIKICGVTRPEDALAAVTAGADAIGLNFYPQSVRFVGQEQARRIAAAVPAGVVRVGVFVNATADEILQTFDRTPLDLIQLHGDEPPEFLRLLGGRPLIRVFRVEKGVGSLCFGAATGTAETRGTKTPAPFFLEYLDRCRQLGAVPRLVLADAAAGRAYGGTGELADWSALAGYPAADWHPPLILAGGLTPDNVADAIRTVRPAGVDTASGVESRPGYKDAERMKRFVETARAALARDQRRRPC
jgi:phosphoribosylanthranilate isomerase